MKRFFVALAILISASSVRAQFETTVPMTDWILNDAGNPVICAKWSVGQNAWFGLRPNLAYGRVYGWEFKRFTGCDPSNWPTVALTMRIPASASISTTAPIVHLSTTWLMGTAVTNPPTEWPSGWNIRGTVELLDSSGGYCKSYDELHPMKNLAQAKLNDYTWDIALECVQSLDAGLPKMLFIYFTTSTSADAWFVGSSVKVD